MTTAADRKSNTSEQQQQQQLQPCDICDDKCPEGYECVCELPVRMPSSQYQEDFKQKTIKRSEFCKQLPNEIFEKGLFDNRTLYRENFQAHDPKHRTQLVKNPHQQHSTDGEFDGTTSYKLDYKDPGKNNCKQTKYRVRLGTEIFPRDQVEPMTTSYADDFVSRVAVRMHIKKRADELGLERAPFDGRTQYREEYKPREHAKVALTKPARSKLDLGNGYRGKPNTVYNCEYQRKDALHQTGRIKPKENLQVGAYGMHGMICYCKPKSEVTAYQKKQMKLLKERICTSGCDQAHSQQAHQQIGMEN